MARFALRAMRAVIVISVASCASPSTPSSMPSAPTSRRPSLAPPPPPQTAAAAAPVVLYPDVLPEIVVDEAFAYFLVSESTRVILKRVPKSGGDAVRLASFRDVRSGPAVDDTSVYVAGDWTIF